MNDKIFISSNAFETKNFIEILDICLKEKFYNIELSSGINYSSDINNIINNLPPSMIFLIHNYFPPEKNSLVLNLASDSNDIRTKSIAFCKKSIDLCVKIKSPIYSVHSGFCNDPEPEQLGNLQTMLSCFDKEKAIKNFYESLEELEKYASANDIILCIENNVIEKRNMPSGKNCTDLMTSFDDFHSFMKEKHLDNIKFLIDLGHLNVSAKTENFDKDEFLDLVASRTSIIHISDNNEELDQHKPFNTNSWCFKSISKFKDAYKVIEISNQSIKNINFCYESINSII